MGVFFSPGLIEKIVEKAMYLRREEVIMDGENGLLNFLEGAGARVNRI